MAESSDAPKAVVPFVSAPIFLPEPNVPRNAPSSKISEDERRLVFCAFFRLPGGGRRRGRFGWGPAALGAFKKAVGTTKYTKYTKEKRPWYPSGAHRIGSIEEWFIFVYFVYFVV